MIRTHHLYAAVLAVLIPCASAQNLNCNLRAHIDKFPGAVPPVNNYAGVWGLVANDSKEYAAVTARTGTIFYDCANPSAPVEKAFIAGPNPGASTGYFWREANGYRGDYFYLSSEHGSLQAISMANPSLPALVGTFGSYAHTVSVDVGAKKLWASGGNYNGCAVFDLASSFTNPTRVTNGGFSSPYVHDCYPIRGFGYFAEIFDGNFQIRNITNVVNPPVLSTVRTPGAFTHNVWTTDDDTIAVTADENHGGCLTVYDISNKALPVQKSTWCSPGGATVHNVFIKERIAHFSCYTDGYWAIDISDPTNPVAVAHYDTTTEVGNDYRGDWGCYPFQPSGVVYLTDMQTGFWIVEPTAGVPIAYGAGSAGTGGLVPLLEHAGGPFKVGNLGYKFSAQRLLPSSQAALVLGVARANVPLLGTNLLIDLTQTYVVIPGTTTSNGTLVVAAGVPANPAFANAKITAQVFVADPNGPGGVLSASAGWECKIAP
jgi:choice-of-anchor B domain-containing protein